MSKAISEIQAKMKTWTDAGIELAYNSGYEQGCKDRDEIYTEDKEDYQRGLDDAWECAKKIYKMTASEIITVFGGCSNWVDYSASEAIAKVREYEQDKPKQDKDETWWQNLGYDIEKLADDWGCTIECIAERANQLWEQIKEKAE